MLKGKALPPLGEEITELIKELIGAILNPVVTEIPKPGLRYSLDTDASEYQLGCAWEPVRNLRRNMEVSYFNSIKMSLPTDSMNP